MTEVGQPQHRRLRPHDRQSDRGAGAGQLRGEPAGRRAAHGAAVQRASAATRICRDDQPHGRGTRTATTSSRALGATYKLSATRRAARRRRRCSSRRSRFRACPALNNRPQSDRLLAQHAGAGDQRQRPDVQAQSDQSRFRAASCSQPVGSGLGPDDQPRRRAGQRVRRPIAINPSTGATASASSAQLPGRLPRRGLVPRADAAATCRFVEP